MHTLAVSIHVWLAALLIVMPIPEQWVKVAIAVLMILLIVLFGL